MPRQEEETFGGEQESYDGFTLMSGGLCCTVCRCLVRKTVGDAAAHREWHAKIGG